MGHFGKMPIRLAWFSVVLPSLVLNYFGQGALLLKNPEAIKNPFFLLAPEWALLPMLILATLATIIASQAVISAGSAPTTHRAGANECRARPVHRLVPDGALRRLFLPR